MNERKRRGGTGVAGRGSASQRHQRQSPRRRQPATLLAPAAPVAAASHTPSLHQLLIHQVAVHVVLLVEVAHRGLQRRYRGGGRRDRGGGVGGCGARARRWADAAACISGRLQSSTTAHRGTAHGTTHQRPAPARSHLRRGRLGACVVDHRPDVVDGLGGGGGGFLHRHAAVLCEGGPGGQGRERGQDQWAMNVEAAAATPHSMSLQPPPPTHNQLHPPKQPTPPPPTHTP